MTFARLLQLLKTLHHDSYDTAAPAGLTRFITATRYGATSVYGSNANAWDFIRVQIDVYVQDPDDALPGMVRDLLRAFSQPYTVQGIAWDDDTARVRTILQTEVIA